MPSTGAEAQSSGRASKQSIRRAAEVSKKQPPMPSLQATAAGRAHQASQQEDAGGAKDAGKGRSRSIR
eukprot:15044584-Alexandrium_andersonii.AAC.1